MIDKYLPIGTIVLLKDGQKRIMITGFACKAEDYGNKVFDYCGCLYPEGVLSTKESLIFNHNQIEHIFSIGYIDEEEKAFKAKLKKIIEDPSNELTKNN